MLEPNELWKLVNANHDSAGALGVALAAFEDEMRQRMDRLRQTAEELREFSRTNGKSGIHPVHAANRIDKIANQIAKEE